ncbi:MAG: hypothetical protein GY903_22105 [Fuerstiella sp.]|nr:hypothetical protein [Fuerstiella sp.]MCP4782303.1 hypothetical protein [Fuerstiella sp.]MCP4857186.1 hypothetical protein [Fuerstiella sp.]
MTVKKRILISIGWFVLIIALGIGGVFWIQSDTVINAERTQRAGNLGTGLGCLGGVGFAFLWLPFAYRVGKQKREARERAANADSGGGRKSRRSASSSGKSRKGKSRSRSRRRKK